MMLTCCMRSGLSNAELLAENCRGYQGQQLVVESFQSLLEGVVEDDSALWIRGDDSTEIVNRLLIKDKFPTFREDARNTVKILLGRVLEADPNNGLILLHGLYRLCHKTLGSVLELVRP